MYSGLPLFYLALDRENRGPGFSGVGGSLGIAGATSARGEGGPQLCRLLYRSSLLPRLTRNVIYITVNATVIVGPPTAAKMQPRRARSGLLYSSFAALYSFGDGMLPADKSRTLPARCVCQIARSGACLPAFGAVGKQLLRRNL